MPVIGSNIIVPPAVPPTCVIVFPSFAKKSSFPRISIDVVVPNGATPLSSTAVGFRGFGSVSFGLPSLSQSNVAHVVFGVPCSETL